MHTDDTTPNAHPRKNQTKFIRLRNKEAQHKNIVSARKKKTFVSNVKSKQININIYIHAMCMCDTQNQTLTNYYYVKFELCAIYQRKDTQPEKRQ